MKKHTALTEQLIEMHLIFWRLNKAKYDISQAIFLKKKLSLKTSQTFPSFLACWVICCRSSESSRGVLYANSWCIIDPWIVFADRSPSVTLDQMSRLWDGKCYHWNGNMWIKGSFGSYRTIGSLETKKDPIKWIIFSFAEFWQKLFSQSSDWHRC